MQIGQGELWGWCEYRLKETVEEHGGGRKEGWSVYCTEGRVGQYSKTKLGCCGEKGNRQQGEGCQWTDDVFDGRTEAEEEMGNIKEGLGDGLC